jgi:hypothetical protein
MIKRNKNSNFKTTKRNKGKWYTLPLASLAVAFAANGDGLSANSVVVDDNTTAISAPQNTGVQSKTASFESAFAKFNTNIAEPNTNVMPKTNENIDKVNLEKFSRFGKKPLSNSEIFSGGIQHVKFAVKPHKVINTSKNAEHNGRGNEEASSVTVLNNQAIVRGVDDIVNFLKAGLKEQLVNTAGSIGDDGKTMQVKVKVQDYIASCLNNMMMAARLEVVSENATKTDDQIKSTVAETLASKKITSDHPDYASKKALLESVMKQARDNATKVENGSFSNFGLKFTAQGKETTARYKDVDSSNLEIMKKGIVDALLLQDNGKDLAQEFISSIRSNEENNAVLNKNIHNAKAKVADKEFKEAVNHLKQYEAEKAAIAARKETMQRNIEAAKAKNLLKSSNNNLNKQQIEPKSTFKGGNISSSMQSRMKMFEGK